MKRFLHYTQTLTNSKSMSTKQMAQLSKKRSLSKQKKETKETKDKDILKDYSIKFGHEMQKTIPAAKFSPEKKQIQPQPWSIKPRTSNNFTGSPKDAPINVMLLTSGKKKEDKELGVQIGGASNVFVVESPKMDHISSYLSLVDKKSEQNKNAPKLSSSKSTFQSPHKLITVKRSEIKIS